MRHISKKLFLIALLTTIATMIQAKCNTGIVTGSPYFFTRSQSRNKVLQDIASVTYTHLHAIDSCASNFDIVLAYEQSFRNGCIADALFAPTGTNTTQCNNIRNCCGNSRSFKIQGSSVIGRDPNAWLADYFYLPTDFNSTITFKPSVSNTLIFLDYYKELDMCWRGAYVRIYGPITFSRWDLGFCEDVTARGSTGYGSGYFNANQIPYNLLLDNFSSYAVGESPQGLSNCNLGRITSAFHPLKYAQLRKESYKKTGFADLRFELGLDHWQGLCYHVGLNIQGAAPTGSKPDAFYTFQPTIGNGKHWEVGGGVTGHYNFWMNAEETHIFSFWIDANITHLFKAHQQRTFDLQNKPISRYMLAERLGTPTPTMPISTESYTLNANTSPGAVSGGVVPSLQFKGEFTPVANLTTLNVNVSFDVQADVVAWFNLIWCDWSFDLGYNFWGTSQEKININRCKNDCKNPLALWNESQTDAWALKGDAQVYGFTSGLRRAVPLSATESNATITSGTNTAIGVPINGASDSTNLGIDNPQYAQADAVVANVHSTMVLFPVTTNPTVQMRTSLNPVTLSSNMIDFTSNQGLTHKVFAHASYMWESDYCIPYLGIGGSAEFAQRDSKRCCQSTCKKCRNNINSTCLRNALSLWSVWIKGGISFN